MIEVPYQDNGWDCGVFVCRYAYALYQLRHRAFSYNDAGVDRCGEAKGKAFDDLVTKATGFNFGKEDIVRLRREIRTLIERLSRLYLRRKKEHDASSKALLPKNRKREEVESKVANDASNEESTFESNGVTIEGEDWKRIDHNGLSEVSEQRGSEIETPREQADDKENCDSTKLESKLAGNSCSTGADPGDSTVDDGDSFMSQTNTVREGLAQEIRSCGPSVVDDDKIPENLVNELYSAEV